MASPTPETTLDCTAQWRIFANSNAMPVQLAVRELEHHWQQMMGQSLAEAETAGDANTINLAVDPTINRTDNASSEDSFAWHVATDQVTIRGTTPRSLLFGVYHFLEAMGYRWLAPGDLWTHIPKLTAPELATVTLPNTIPTQRPAFAGRCLILGHYAFIVDAAAWIEWAARNRYNTIFIHTAPNDFGGGSIPEWAWQRVRKEAMAMLQEREMIVEVGGHGLPALLPRKLFKTTPEAFREENGKRTKKHNFCPSSPQAKAAVQENARRYFQANPDVDVYHIWADDIPDGGWCSCKKCARLSTSDQLLLATNTVAAVLAEVHPDAEISFIAYLDTEAPPSQIEPRNNVCLLWAPRTRNYGRATDDERCPVNTPRYPEMLRAQIGYFANAGTARVFEYYSDAVLFKSVLPILNNVIQQDLRFYRDAGVHTVQTLMTGTRPWVTAQLTNWLLGRLLWNPEHDVEGLVADFCQAVFGNAGVEIAQYYAALEEAFALVLHQTPDQRREMVLPSSPLAMITHPLADMEDPVHASAETLRQRADEMSTLFDRVARAEQYLTRARALADSPQLQAETKAFGLTRSWLHFCGHRIRLYASIASAPIAPDALMHWQAANDAYHQVEQWADAHLPPLFSRNVKLIHLAMWSTRLRRIQADHFTAPLLRWSVDGGTLGRLIYRFTRLVWHYKTVKRN